MPIHLNNQSGDSIYHRESIPPKNSISGLTQSSEYKSTQVSIPVWTVPQSADGNIVEKELSSKKFVWPYGGTDVKLTGTFDNWQASIQMTPVNISNLNSNIFQVIVKGLDLSKDIQYKFVVDGKWCYDMKRAHITEAAGNINNIIYAEK